MTNPASIMQGVTYYMRAPWSRQTVSAEVIATRKRWFGRTAVVRWNVVETDSWDPFKETHYTRTKTVMARRLFTGND